MWSDALAPGGLLLLEETELITTTDPDVARYEELVRVHVVTSSAPLYAGPLIASNMPQSAELVVDRVLPIDLTAGQAAAMFARNLAAWGPDAVAARILTDVEQRDLLTRLRARDDDQTRGLFDWTQHQTIARRR